MKLKIQQAKKRILRPTGARLTRFDPTQTTTLRNTFGAEINRYFAHLRRCINELFTEEDALGLKSPKPVTNVFCPTGKGGGIDPTCSPPNKNTLAIMEKYKDEQAWKEPIEEYMESVGLTLGDYNKVNELLYQHNLSSGEESDIALSNLWNSQDSPGRALREFSKWNEWQSLNSSREKPDWSYARKQIARNPSSYKMFEGGSVSDSVDRFKEYMQATERGEPIFYRKGGLDRNAVSTTTSRTGARSGGSHFIPDRWFSFQELKNAGYHLISGARGMVGVTSSQEREHIWLKPRETPVANTRWKYLDSQGKVKAFATWLRYMNYLWMKGTYGSNQKAWPTKKPMEDLWKDYINAGFAKGAGRSFDDVRKQTKGLKKSLDWYNGNREEFLRSSFAAPESVDKVKLLVSQGFSELEGVTKDAEIRLTRKLADGLVQGQHPKSIAKTIADDLDISRKRALRIAHTELIRAHAGGQLISLKRLGVEKVGVAVEWSTARDEKVCPLCKALAGIVLSIDEAWGLIPRHPGCRCAFVPAVIAELHMIRTKSAIEAALKLSSKKGKGTWKWPTISKDRPSLVSVENAATIPYTRGIAVIDRFLINQKENCGTGAGGFKEGNTCWKNKKSFLAAKSALLSYLQDEENNYASSGVIKSHLGASAEEISEVLKELSEEGLIDTYGGSDPSTSSLSSGLAIGKKNIYGIQLTDKGKEYADTPFAEELATDEADETPLADLFDETPSLPEEPPAKVAEISLDDLFAEDAFDEAPVASPIFPELKELKLVKTLSKGYSKPSLMEDAGGNKWIVKLGDADHLKSESEADAIYRELGLNAPLSTTAGKHKIAEFVEGTDLDDLLPNISGTEFEEIKKKIQKGFVADALLANWDAVGVGDVKNSNIRVTPSGEIYRIDNGGALKYSGTGKLKGADFSGDVKELWTLRNSAVNPTAAKIYGGIKDSEIASQIVGVLKKKEDILLHVSDPETKKILGQRFNDLALILPSFTQTPIEAFGVDVGEEIALKPKPKTEEPKPEPKAKTPEGYSPTNPLHSPEGISDYVASKFKEAGVVALTPAFIAKVKKMNPHGISGGVYKTPWVDKWQLPILKKVLPWNTKIKQGTFDSATNDLKKTYSTKKFGGDVFTTEAAPATPEVKPQAPPKPAKTIQASLLPTPPKLPKYNSQPELAQKNQEAINELTELAKKGDLKAIEPFLSHPSKWVNSYASGLKDSIQEQLGEKPPPYEHLEQVGEVEYATTEELKAAMLPYLPSISSGGKVKFAHSPAIDKKAQESWKAKLTASEKSAISSWKGSPSEIRESIAKGKPTPQAKAILSAMDKAKAHQGILYRGVHSEYADKIMAQIDDAGVGCLWSDAAPHGMSPNPAVASKFSYGKVLFRIIAKTAKPIWKEDGYSGDGYDSLSEKECLGYPGRKYKVTGIYQDVTIGDNKGTNMPYSQIKRVIDLEEI